ncbi:hypothetical protein ZOSMA_241G00410 [Zostera marina]|uniref:Uncharacterized protein n=1 Tax=Zostera marina TaxID=29655 RepID=A0A0K9PH62_ZOSMR|nr:hypothetical protein ZOSMA_241G00410 [Zostera marina]
MADTGDNGVSAYDLVSLVRSCCEYDQSIDAAEEELSETASWVLGSMTERLDKLKINGQPIICKIPNEIRAGHDRDYEPNIIAIGPYHREKPALKPMKEVKLMYLRHICDRNEEKTLRRYVVAMEAVELEARRMYNESFEIDSNDFIEMLVVDGCFIVEFLLKRAEGRVGEFPLAFQLRAGPTLRRDFLLFENQIPFFVLQKILDLTTHLGGLTILDIALHYLYKGKMSKEALPVEEREIHHLLHLSHLCLVSKLKYSQEETSDESPPKNLSDRLFVCLKHGLIYALVVCFNVVVIWKWSCWSHFRSDIPAKDIQRMARTIPTATQLKEAGVHFKKKETNKCFLDISFKDGNMEIPAVTIQENTSSEYRNFLALEQTCKDYGNKFTSYVVFMDNLIDTAHDVALLKKSKIIESKLGCAEDVAMFFNEIRSGLCFDFNKHYLVGIFKDVNSYYNKTINRWRATLMHDYLSSPWAIISLMGAIVLIILTTLQTAYSIN